jgi:hypothetical protein
MKKLSNALLKLGFVQTDHGDGHTTFRKVSETGMVLAGANYFALSNNYVMLSGFWSIKEMRTLSTWMAAK